LGNGMDNSRPYPASDANGLAGRNQFGGTPKRTGDPLYDLPGFQCDEVPSAFADRLDYQCDGAGRQIRIGDSERDSFSTVTEVNDNELSGLAHLGDSGSQDVEACHIWAQTSRGYDLVHMMAGFTG
jgi:hypothetical protein